MKLSESAARVVGILEEQGFEAFCVGGCVRDALMGREPHDYDVTTNALPDQMKQCFRGLHLIETGLKHGTLTVRIGGESVEVTTYRVDGEYLDNRRPSEVFFASDIRDDLSRRDFTVNAMAYSPTRGLVDEFGGREDLGRRLIRCVGDPDRRFGEDGLRILRALRFASVLDFDIDGDTAYSIHKNLSLLTNISSERIAAELFKLVGGVGAERILLAYPDVLCKIIPEFEPSVGFDQKNPYHIYDVYTHSLRALGAADGDVYVKLAVLFHDIGKPACFSEDGKGGHFYGHHTVSAELTERALRRLKADGKTLRTVVKLVDNHDRSIPVTQKGVRRLLAALGEEDARRLLSVRRADNSALVGWLTEPRLAELDEIQTLLDEVIAEGNCLSLKTLAVHGDDLLALGMKPGREIGDMLNRLLGKVLDGELPNEREALLAQVRGFLGV